MIETHDLTKFARRIFLQGRRRVPQPRTIYPEREWFFIVSGFILLFLCGAGMSVWYYSMIQSVADNVTGRKENSVPVYQAAAVEKVHEQFAAREDTHTTLLRTASEARNSTPLATGTTTEVTSEEAPNVSATTSASTTSNVGAPGQEPQIVPGDGTFAPNETPIAVPE
jgi:hypothetical protein